MEAKIEYYNERTRAMKTEYYRDVKTAVANLRASVINGMAEWCDADIAAIDYTINCEWTSAIVRNVNYVDRMKPISYVA